MAVVCMKPTEADTECVQTGTAGRSTALPISDVPRGGKAARRVRGSGSKWGMLRMAGGTTGIVCLLVFLSALAASFFWLFRKY